jgi:hypothetical protein
MEIENIFGLTRYNGFFHYNGKAIFLRKFALFNGNSRNDIFLNNFRCFAYIHKRFIAKMRKKYMQTLAIVALLCCDDKRSATSKNCKKLWRSYANEYRPRPCMPSLLVDLHKSAVPLVKQ